MKIIWINYSSFHGLNIFNGGNQFSMYILNYYSRKDEYQFFFIKNSENYPINKISLWIT